MCSVHCDIPDRLACHTTVLQALPALLVFFAALWRQEYLELSRARCAGFFVYIYPHLQVTSLIADVVLGVSPIPMSA